MASNKKKVNNLRDKLPVVDIADAVQERQNGHEWFRVSKLAKENEVSTSSILNWIKSGKLEGCTLCGMIHGRELKTSIEGSNDENQTAEGSEISQK
jgi:hypothetical protein